MQEAPLVVRQISLRYTRKTTTIHRRNQATEKIKAFCFKKNTLALATRGGCSQRVQHRSRLPGGVTTRGVEQTTDISFLFRLLFLLLLNNFLSNSASAAAAAATTSTGGHGRELGGTISNQLVKVLENQTRKQSQTHDKGSRFVARARARQAQRRGGLTYSSDIQGS